MKATGTGNGKATGPAGADRGRIDRGRIEMTNSEFTKLLQRCSRASEKHLALTIKIHEECKRRYGMTFSDVDADGIIDILCYGGGDINATDFEKEMERAMETAGYDVAKIKREVQQGWPKL